MGNRSNFGVFVGENRVEHRQQVFQWLSGINESQAHDLFDLDLVSEACPLMWQALILRPDVLNRYLLGNNAKPPIVVNNLASLLTTPLEWNALILPESVYADLDEIDLWLEHGSTLEKEWQLEGKLRPGFRALFYGPPGTGKTLTATLLGKRTERPVYRVDIGAVTSKYIGETEKNLEQVFSMAEKHNWLLFLMKRMHYMASGYKPAVRTTSLLTRTLPTYCNELNPFLALLFWLPTYRIILMMLFFVVLKLQFILLNQTKRCVSTLEKCAA